MSEVHFKIERSQPAPTPGSREEDNIIGKRRSRPSRHEQAGEASEALRGGSMDTTGNLPFSHRSSCLDTERDSSSSKSARDLPSDTSYEQASASSKTSVEEPSSAPEVPSDGPAPAVSLEARESNRMAALKANLPRMSISSLPPRRRKSLIKHGAAARPRCTDVGLPCVFCMKPLGDTVAEVQAHVREHMQRLSGEYHCEPCQLGFSHLSDLLRHQHYARQEKPDCGFPFDHVTECTGHHAPDPNTKGLSDHDRMRMHTQLRHWEQALLHAFMQNVDEALKNLRPTEDLCWSIGAVRRSSIASLTTLSTLFSRMEVESTPDNVDYGARKNLEQVRQNMTRRLSSGLPIKIFFEASKRRSTLTSSKSLADEVPERLDTLLISAAAKGSLIEARELLHAGADVNGRHSDSLATPLSLAATHGHLDLAKLFLKRKAEFSRVIFFQEEPMARDAMSLALHAHKSDVPSALFSLMYMQREHKNLDACKLSVFKIAQKSGLDVRACSYAVSFSRESSGDFYHTHMKVVSNERERGQLQGYGCALITGDDRQKPRYCTILPEIVAAFDLDDLPAGVIICSALGRKHYDLALLLMQHYSLLEGTP